MNRGGGVNRGRGFDPTAGPSRGGAQRGGGFDPNVGMNRGGSGNRGRGFDEGRGDFTRQLSGGMNPTNPEVERLSEGINPTNPEVERLSGGMNPSNPEVETSMADFLRNQQDREEVSYGNDVRNSRSAFGDSRSLNRNEENLLRDSFGSMDRIGDEPPPRDRLFNPPSTSSHDPELEKLKTIMDTVNTLASARAAPDPYMHQQQDHTGAFDEAVEYVEVSRGPTTPLASASVDEDMDFAPDPSPPPPPPPPDVDVTAETLNFCNVHFGSFPLPYRIRLVCVGASGISDRKEFVLDVREFGTSNDEYLAIKKYFTSSKSTKNLDFGKSGGLQNRKSVVSATLMHLQSVKARHHGQRLTLVFDNMVSKKVFLELFTSNTDLQATLCSIVQGFRIKTNQDEGLETLSVYSFDPDMLSIRNSTVVQKKANIVYYGEIRNVFLCISYLTHIFSTQM